MEALPHPTAAAAAAPPPSPPPAAAAAVTGAGGGEEAVAGRKRPRNDPGGGAGLKLTPVAADAVAEYLRLFVTGTRACGTAQHAGGSMYPLPPTAPGPAASECAELVARSARHAGAAPSGGGGDAGTLRRADAIRMLPSVLFDFD